MEPKAAVEWMDTDQLVALFRFAAHNPHVNTAPARFEPVLGWLERTVHAHWDVDWWAHVLEATSRLDVPGWTLPENLFGRVKLITAARLVGIADDPAGRSVVARVAQLERCEVWMATLMDSAACSLWRPADCAFVHDLLPSYPVPLLRMALRCTNGWFVTHMLAQGKSFAHMEPLHLGSPEAVAAMVSMGCNLDAPVTKHRDGEPWTMLPLECVRSCAAARYMVLEVGCQVAPLLQRYLCPPRVLRWLLEMDPSRVRELDVAYLVANGVDRCGSLRSTVSLQYVKLLRDYNVDIPRAVVQRAIAHRSDQMVCALLTHGYIARVPRHLSAFPGRWFAWSHFSHRFYGDQGECV